MNDDWRRYRPAIWLAMLGLALALLVSPPYLGGVCLGAAVGIAIRIRQRRRRIAGADAAAVQRQRRPR